jgi:hypothetical protein
MLADVGDFLAVDEGMGLGRGIGFAMLRPASIPSASWSCM